MKISVITASYNYDKYIAETIESVLNQTYTDWEMLIIDDGSTDNSVEVIKSYNDPRIKLIQNPENKGLKETLLIGIAQASGEWIAFLESDDMWREDYLAKKVQIAKEYPNTALIFNDVETFGDDLLSKQAYVPFRHRNDKLLEHDYPRNMFYDFFQENRVLTFSCAMIRKDILEKTDFNTPVDKLLDWWLWVHIAFENEFYYIGEQLTKWRLHNESYIYSKRFKDMRFVNLEAYWDIYKKTRPNARLLRFIITSFIKYILLGRIYAYINRSRVRFIRKIKKLLGLALREHTEYVCEENCSPLPKNTQQAQEES